MQRRLCVHCCKGERECSDLVQHASFIPFKIDGGQNCAGCGLVIGTAMVTRLVELKHLALSVKRTLGIGYHFREQGVTVCVCVCVCVWCEWKCGVSACMVCVGVSTCMVCVCVCVCIWRECMCVV